ncbi:MAG: hypothetical protein M3N38_07100, partial [Pseudomonadota bacterium]|nr:hypothetical protein [Pseudomonadota bacterium]
PSVYARTRAEEVSQDRFSARYAIASSLQTVDDLALGLEAAAAQNHGFPTLSIETEVHFESAAEQRRFAEEATAGFEAIARKYQRPRGKRSFCMKLQCYPKAGPN